VPIITVNGPQPNMAMTVNCANGFGGLAVPSGPAIVEIEEEVGSYGDGHLYLYRNWTAGYAIFIRQYFQ